MEKKFELDEVQAAMVLNFLQLRGKEFYDHCPNFDVTEAILVALGGPKIPF